MNVALRPAFVAGKLVDYATFMGKKSPVERVKCTGGKSEWVDNPLEEVPEDVEVFGATVSAVRTSKGLQQVTSDDVILVGDEGEIVVLPKTIAELMYEPV